MNIYPIIFAMLYFYSFPAMMHKQCANLDSCQAIEKCIFIKKDSMLNQDAVDEQENLTTFLYNIENKFKEMNCHHHESFDDDTV